MGARDNLQLLQQLLAVLNDSDRRTIYISEGLAHGFLALQDNSTVMYLCSAEYDPQREHTICATDPRWQSTGLWSTAPPQSLSARDAAAPNLDEVHESGLLPSWEETQKFIAGLPSK
jgi:dTDP-4-dehydrorhamnose 3,5-epimerase